MVIAVIDHAALVRGHLEPGESCEVRGVGPVSVSTVRSMMADAFLAAVVRDGVDIRSVAHLGRQVTAKQQTALRVRDPVCVVPGCSVRKGLEIDHITGWKVTHSTSLGDLASLCREHHRQKTFEGAEIHGPPGRWRWTPPDRRFGLKKASKRRKN